MVNDLLNALPFKPPPKPLAAEIIPPLAYLTGKPLNHATAASGSGRA